MSWPLPQAYVVHTHTSLSHTSFTYALEKIPIQSDLYFKVFFLFKIQLSQHVFLKA